MKAPAHWKKPSGPSAGSAHEGNAAATPSFARVSFSPVVRPFGKDSEKATAGASAYTLKLATASGAPGAAAAAHVSVVSLNAPQLSAPGATTGGPCSSSVLSVGDSHAPRSCTPIGAEASESAGQEAWPRL